MGPLGRDGPVGPVGASRKKIQDLYMFSDQTQGPGAPPERNTGDKCKNQDSILTIATKSKKSPPNPQILGPNRARNGLKNVYLGAKPWLKIANFGGAVSRRGGSRSNQVVTGGRGGGVGYVTDPVPSLSIERP